MHKASHDEILLHADPTPCQDDRWDWDIETFERHRAITWDPSCLGLYRTRSQKIGFSGVTGCSILKSARKMNVSLANVHLLEYFKKRPEITPAWVREGWYLYFLPLYYEKKGPAFLRYLHWDACTELFEEGDTLYKGAGFAATCGLVTYKGLTSL